MNKKDLLNPNKVKVVKKYFFAGLDLVDEGANGEEFTFFKRLGQGGEKQMSEILVAPELKPEQRKKIMTQLDKEEGIKGDALKKQQAEMDAMEAELKQAEAENATLKIQTFEEAKKGIEPRVEIIDPNTMQPVATSGFVHVDNTTPYPSVTVSEQAAIQAEMDRIELENMKLRLEKLREENAMLKGRIPMPLGMSRKTEVRLQSLEDKKEEKPVEEKTTNYHSMADLEDDFANDLRNDPNVGIISGR
jgi:hypothetical protein